ncbi:SDR family NAD(P)-dependent oxidoreductase [Lichenifustis flavocetrariae]|uniref:SDR family oxidoreductase n=1 Tax=Lichenifustis flavocetrariae TaxID=2949735 RepID=A0AA41YYA4_9HYPH|nr:SDR family NAD(P)-dependent oxidoreductase [Lichenifustis flavocetrariae]MCW6509283.1 SDR family oxidoreductase [Lichenifustis flavocetrariae]
MPKTFDLTGRKALVTGGSRGIGAAVVEILCAHGAQVAFCHVDDEANAMALIERLSTVGASVHGRACDVADEDQVAALAQWAEATLGQVDILVNCAGIGGHCAFGELTIAAWDRMIGVHLRGTFLVTHHFFDKMVARRWGRIVNFSSQLAYKGGGGMAHYCAAKAGILGFTRALSYEGAPHNVLVNGIAPGPIETDMLKGLSDEWRAAKMGELPIKRFGEPDEMAPTVLMLASEAGSYYVGQTLSPNGGDVMV